jgi:hypothetical protein
LPFLNILNVAAAKNIFIERLLKMNFAYPPVLTVHDVQQIMRIGRSQAYQLCQSGYFRVVKIGKSIRVDADSFFAWLQGKN